jgi:hypothetical protein
MNDHLETLDRRMSNLTVSVARKLTEKIKDPDSVSGAYLSAGRLFLTSMGKLREVKDAIAETPQGVAAEEEAIRKRDASLPGFSGAQQKVKLR